MNIQNLGCDPEVFLHDGKEFISSQFRIGGTKDNPMPIDDLGNALQEDNVTVEFNTPPCANVNDFIKHIRFNLQEIYNRVEFQGLKLEITPSATFSDAELASPGAQEFGCEPDFNAYTGKANPRPKAENQNLRSAGGHIHIQCDGSKVDRLLLIKWMDVYVGCALLEYDKDRQRRELYGRAGAFRPKKYGVEYRTPSNIWITTDDLIRFVWDQTDKALGRALAGDQISEEVQLLVQTCINESKFELYPEICSLLNVE